MKEISELNQNLAKERKSTTLYVATLLCCGLASSVPLFTDTIKYQESLFCYSQGICSGNTVRHGVSFLIDRERRNYLFDQNVKILKILPPEDENVVLFGFASSSCLLCAYILSRSLSDKQERAIHSQFKLLKIKALENDLIEQFHVNLFEFSRGNEAEITKQVIARQTAETSDEIKSPSERQAETINGQLQGELAIKHHELQISELSKEIANNNLSAAEINRKLDKINQPSTISNQATTDEQPKLMLIEALKSHQDGWLWKIISTTKPLWLTGNQGSGKTWTAAAIALIRRHCFDAPVQYIIDRHATGDNAEVWRYLQPSMKAESESEIALAFEDCCDRWLLRIKDKTSTREQVIVDEFTNLQSLVGESAMSFFRSSLTDTRKARVFLLGITHNTTNESFPPGTAAARKAGSILLERFSADGEKPLDRIVIKYGLVDPKGNSLEDEERAIPCWFNPQRIQQHFSGKLINFEA